MSTNAAPLEQQVKSYLNQQTAELLVLRVTLQVLVWNIVRHEPLGAGILDLLRQEVMSSLTTTLAVPPGLQRRQELEQIKQMTLDRAEKLFQDIAKVQGGPPPSVGAEKATAAE